MAEHPGALQHFVAARNLAISGRGFDNVGYEVKPSQEPRARIKELASAAAADCYATNTLMRSCMVTGAVPINDEKLMDL